MRLTKNSAYRVEVTNETEEQLMGILRYLRVELNNEQAARGLSKAFDDARWRLAYLADSLKICEDFKNGKYRKIHLKKYNYFILYEIIGNEVRIVGIYHGRQDL